MLKPLMLQGTTPFGRGIDRGTAVAFQIMDPVYRIPMIWPVVTAEFGSSYVGTYRPHVKTQGERVLRFFDSLQTCAGIERLWVTPTLIIATCNPEHEDRIGGDIKKAIGNTFGDFNHQFVGENQIDVQIGQLMANTA